MKNQPLVSVIIPLYNNEKYIEDALNSVFAQDYSNLEVIVVNDGSTDNSVAALDKFLDRIILINQENNGQPAARNVAIHRSTGKYIASLDADDIWLPGKIKAQVEFMETNPDFGGVHACRVKWVLSDRGPLDLNYDFSTLPIDNIEHFSGWILKEFLENKCSDTITFMFKRECFIEIGLYDINIPVCTDFDLGLRMSSKFKIHKLDILSAVYRINKESISFRYDHIHYRHKILNKLKRLIKPNELLNNNIKLDVIKNKLSTEYMELSFFYLWKKSFSLSLKYLSLALVNNIKNKEAYRYILTQSFKIPLKIFMSRR